MCGEPRSRIARPAVGNAQDDPGSDGVGTDFQQQGAVGKQRPLLLRMDIHADGIRMEKYTTACPETANIIDVLQEYAMFTVHKLRCRPPNTPVHQYQKYMELTIP